MTAALEVPTRSSAEITAERDERVVARDQRRQQLAQLQNERKDAVAQRRVLYAKQATGEQPTADEVAAEPAVTKLDGEIVRLEAALELDDEKIAELDIAIPIAAGDKLVAQQVHFLEQRPRVKRKVLERVIALIQALDEERATDVAEFRTRVDLDAIAEKTGLSRFRRGAFAFDGANRPQLRYLGDVVAPLMRELDVTFRDGEIVPRVNTNGVAGGDAQGVAR